MDRRDKNSKGFTRLLYYSCTPDHRVSCRIGALRPARCESRTQPIIPAKFRELILNAELISVRIHASKASRPKFRRNFGLQEFWANPVKKQRFGAVFSCSAPARFWGSGHNSADIGVLAANSRPGNRYLWGPAFFF